MGDQGGGSYEAQIPAASDGESMELKVQATDSNGLGSETASDSDNLPNCRVGWLVTGFLVTSCSINHGLQTNFIPTARFPLGSV